ncbi:MAG: hypothetical protein KAJ10_14410, partial [Thermodesulfovibrionia bacterium]|nr:hypothetical protein [Thermodesulfovibrionia bacterium]
MAETSKIDRYAAPNETTTISPVQIEVSFLLWNYCQPQDLDELVRNDPWSDAMKSFKSRFSFGDIFNPISPWLDKTIGIGLRSDQIEPVKTFKELKRLLNGPDISENVAGLDIIGLDDDFGNMSAFIDDLFPVHFIHIFQIKEGEIKEPVILEYRSAKDWTAVFPNGSISRSEGDYFSISTSTKAFVLPLPYRMTDEAITMTVDMFSQSIHNPDVKGGCESFRIEFNSDWLKNNGALKRHETGGIGLWSIPLFSPFHIAIKMSHLLKDRLKWVGITDLKQKSSELSIKEQEVHYRAIYSGIMKQLYDQDKDLKDELNKGFLEFEYHRYNLSFRIACSRLARSVEYLLNSWMVLQLEKTNRIDEELRTNGNAWVDLFRILSDALNGHPTGTIPYQYRREIHGEYRENNEFYSPIVAWMEKMIDKRLVHKKGGVDEWGVSEDDPLLSGVMNTEEKTLWDRSGEVKDALGKYDAIFDMYVSIRVFDLWEEGESLRKWHKRLSESADRFQENLGIFYKVRKISDTVGKGIGYANYCHNLLD